LRLLTDQERYGAATLDQLKIKFFVGWAPQMLFNDIITSKAGVMQSDLKSCWGIGGCFTVGFFGGAFLGLLFALVILSTSFFFIS
jgi:hypothetical protein